MSVHEYIIHGYMHVSMHISIPMLFHTSMCKLMNLVLRRLEQRLGLGTGAQVIRAERKSCLQTS